MNKKLGMAVAGAVMAFGATAANAGITIPAGDWTIDIGGNVNAYYTNTDTDVKVKARRYGESNGGEKDWDNTRTTNPDLDDANTIGTGLLPAALGIGGKTRQNDLDIAFQFTFFTGTSAGDGSLGGLSNSAAGRNTLNIRQAYMTFGDASWGTIKAGRDLGIFGSDAILSDMTLLGVGVGGPAGGSSTLGRIGSGYIYADWVGQISYHSPNWNGFSFAAGVREPWSSGNATENRKNMGFEGKASYEWAGDVSGKVWTGFITQRHEGNNGVACSDYTDDTNAGAFVCENSQPYFSGNDYTDVAKMDSYTSRAWEVGAKVNVAGFSLLGYYYDGKGIDSQNSGIAGGLQFLNGEKSDDNGGYVQAMYTIPNWGTKLGVSYGINKSESDVNRNAEGGWDIENKSWIVGVYHPLTKSVNLVVEYTDQEIEADYAVQRRTWNSGFANRDLSIDTDVKTLALGAIMFF